MIIYGKFDHLRSEWSVKASIGKSVQMWRWGTVTKVEKGWEITVFIRSAIDGVQEIG